MNDITPYNHVFRDLLAGQTSNSPQAWTAIGSLLDRFAQEVKGMVIPKLGLAVIDAAKATATLFCVVLTAKAENADLGLQSMMNQSPPRGRSFGHQLINWTLSKMDLVISPDMSVTWAAMCQQMASAIEVMIRELQPVGQTMTPEQVSDWITRHGGIGKLHMDYMAIRRNEKRAERERAERDRQAGAEARKQAAAREAGFGDVDAYEAHQARQAAEQRETKLRSQFAELRAGFVARGTLTTMPPDGRLLIASEGRLYILSDADEYALMSCAASTL